MKYNALNIVIVFFLFVLGCDDNKTLKTYNVVYQALTEDENLQFRVEYIKNKSTVSVDTVTGIFALSTYIYVDSIGITATVLEPRGNNKIKAILYVNDELIKEATGNNNVLVSYVIKE
jgi:hypothetical protein